MGCVGSDSAITWKEKMLKYERNILDQAGLKEPYEIRSNFVEIEMDNVPLDIRVHNLKNS